MPNVAAAGAPAMPTAAPAPEITGWGEKPPVAPESPPSKLKKKKQATERKTMCWLKRADLPGSPTPQYPAIWVMMKCMEHGIHEIAPYDSQKTAKWNEVIQAFHQTWGAIYPAAASAAKAAIEAQVTKVLEGYKAIISASPTGKHTGAGNIKNYALTDNELEAVRIYLMADLAARQERESAHDGKPKLVRKRQASSEEDARLLDNLNNAGKKPRMLDEPPQPSTVLAAQTFGKEAAPMDLVLEHHALFSSTITALAARVKVLEDAAGIAPVPPAVVAGPADVVTGVTPTPGVAPGVNPGVNPGVAPGVNPGVNPGVTGAPPPPPVPK